ncbi:UDP-4-amino-4-deoxy-L-arabinose-oxoglutarate aminotransferase [Rhodopirellula sp. SM50]|nr:DegT/DnrJ/EryC1/StrS family aminotransferase [Rhodopirellula sp. SM50]PAY16607.1 UDP-4-amino-4-deoxy-L-arabinose-oxoglutarate aminotransferase [Rhodopirellula sp. SM50]
MNVRLFKPSLGQEELLAVQDCFERSWIGLGPRVNEFENAWKAFLGCNEAIALNSATAALHLALAVFRFSEGKKVLVPSLTFASTATAVLYNRLEPVFVDSDPITLGMDLSDLDKKYDRDCVAVMPVHYAGHPVDMEKLVPWARERKLKIIEDCAHTSGSEYKGTPLGLWGDISCFSFEEKKLMTTGDGGMMCSNDVDLLKDVRAMRWVGIDKDNWKSAQAYTDANKDAMHWFYELSVLGYKYNMNDLAASVGIVQLGKLPEMNQRRSEILKHYMNGISNDSSILPLLPYRPDQYAYQIFGVRTPNRDEFIIHLKSRGVATGCHYTPLSLQPLFREFASDCHYIEEEINRCVTLPLHPDLTDSEVEYVLEGIRDFCRS